MTIENIIIGKQGSSLGEFYGPTGLHINKDNKLYAADYGNKRVQVAQIQDDDIKFVHKVDAFWPTKILTNNNDQLLILENRSVANILNSEGISVNKIILNYGSFTVNDNNDIFYTDLIDNKIFICQNNSNFNSNSKEVILYVTSPYNITINKNDDILVQRGSSNIGIIDKNYNLLFDINVDKYIYSLGTHYNDNIICSVANEIIMFEPSGKKILQYDIGCGFAEGVVTYDKNVIGSNYSGNNLQIIKNIL